MPSMFDKKMAQQRAEVSGSPRDIWANFTAEEKQIALVVGRSLADIEQARTLLQGLEDYEDILADLTAARDKILGRNK